MKDDPVDDDNADHADSNDCTSKKCCSVSLDQMLMNKKMRYNNH